MLITGPTGSGKTTTLYSAIHEVVTGDRNLITGGAGQRSNYPESAGLQIDEKSGMTFAAGLRSVLRQDPDIIMVGEIRDKVTANWRSGGVDRSPGPGYRAHRRRTFGGDATGGHGCASVPDRLVADHGHRTTSGAQALSLLQGARPADAETRERHLTRKLRRRTWSSAGDAKMQKRTGTMAGWASSRCCR